MNPKTIFLMICSITLFACSAIDPITILSSNPQVEDFLEKYPDADILIVKVTPEMIEKENEFAFDICGILLEKEKYYKGTINDVSSNLEIVAYVDIIEKEVACVRKIGKNSSNENFNTIPKYVVIQHYDPVSQEVNPSGLYDVAVKQIEYATDKNIKLSIWLGAGITKYILKSDDRINLVKEWIEFGHEIGVHHHSIYKQHKSWDGYTSLPEDEALAIRNEYIQSDDVEPYYGDQEDYMAIFNELEDELWKKGVFLEVKSGVNNEHFNKATSMPDDIIYGTGSGFNNFGEPGRFYISDYNLSKARNDFITVGIVNGIERKWLNHYYVGSLDQLEAGKEFFDGMNMSVFVGVTHNYAHEQEAYYSFIDYLNFKDPNGDNSMTVSDVIESGILPEKNIDLLCEDNGGTICGGLSSLPGACDGEWLDTTGYPHNYYGEYNCCLGNCIHEDKCDLNNDGIIDKKELILCSGDKSELCGNGVCDKKENNDPRLCPKDCNHTIPYYFLVIHHEPHHNESTQSDSFLEEYNVTKRMVDKADEYGIKLTLMFSPQWSDFLLSSEERINELNLWKASGHEISVHHHSIYHGNWDGYTDFGEEESNEIRLTKTVNPETYLGTLGNFMTIVKNLNSNMNSGCVNDEADKNVMPDDIIYNTCSGYANFKEPGLRLTDGADPRKGWSEFISVGKVNGIKRYWLTHYQTTKLENVNNAKNFFSTINSGIYGSVNHNFPWEEKAFNSWIQFLHENDPDGEKSMTLSEAIESNIFSEKELSQDLIDTVYYGSSNELCGDGICDFLEMENSDLCPKDCVSAS